MFDGKAFGQEIVEIVRGHVSRSLEPLIERIAALEARHPERGEKGEPGEPGEPGPAGEPGSRGEDGAPGRDGKDADPEAVAGILAAQMQDEIESVIDRAVAERVKAAVAAIPAPKDGVGLAGALIDRDGNLVITLTDGSTRPLGPVVGCDGKDGAPGKDGADGLGFDDMTAAYDGARGITLRFERGERVKEYAFEMPVVIDRGVYKAGERYSAGDGVTWAGSYWIAQEATTEKPDTGKGWRLAVKRGRDGKAAA